MKKVHLFKGVLLGLVVALSAASEAKVWTNKGAFLDASQNLYTACYYPASANLRVSKRNSSNSIVWVHDFAAASGWKFQAEVIVRLDSAGNIYVAAKQGQTSGTNNRFVVYKITNAGANTAGSPAIYAPAPAGQSVIMGGFAIDSADKPILVGSYNTTTYTQGFALKYTTYPGTYSVQPVNYSATYNTQVDDLQLDASNNAYIASHSWPSAGSTNYATITKVPTAFTSVTNYSDMLTAGWFPGNGGSLTLDSSGRLTFLLAVSNGISTTDVFGTQRNTSGTLTWTPSLLGFNDMDVSWSVVDASGNIYVTGGATASAYEIAKISPAKVIQWDTSVVTPNVYPFMLALDAGGDPLIITAAPSGGGKVARILRFSNSTGSNTATYNYSGLAGSDHGYSLLPSSTSGVYYAAGVGNSGGAFYPLVYKYTVGGSPAVTWSEYQTMIIP